MQSGGKKSKYFFFVEFKGQLFYLRGRESQLATLKQPLIFAVLNWSLDIDSFYVFLVSEMFFSGMLSRYGEKLLTLNLSTDFCVLLLLD